MPWTRGDAPAEQAANGEASIERASARVLGWQLAALAVVVFAAAAAGIGARATYGAQTTADEPQYLLTAISIAEDGDLDIADELGAQRWRAFHEAQLPVQTKPLPGGREISPHDPLLPLLLALPVALGGWVGAKLATAAMAALLAAAIAWVAVRRLRVAPAVALPTVGVLGASAPLAAYGTQIYPEIPAALAVTAALGVLLHGLDRRGCWVLTASVIALPWLAVKYVPVAAALAGVAIVRLLRDDRRRSAAGLAIALAAAGVVFAVVHVAVWTGLTAYASGDHFVGGEFTAVGSSPNYLGRSVRLIGLLVDRQFGIAAWQPAWLLLVPAAVLVARRRVPHSTMLLVVLGVGWLNATFVALTMQGYWFPGRQVVVVLPAAILVLLLAGRDVPWLRRVVPLVGLVGVWSYGWLVAAGRSGAITWVVDFFTVGDPWYRAWSALLPAYTSPSSATWVRHTLWLAAAAAAAGAAWLHAARYEVSSSTPDAEPEALPDALPEALPDADPSSSSVRTEAPSSPPQAVADSSRARTAPDRRNDRARDDTEGSLNPTRMDK